jgi:nitrate reductase NapE component
LQPDKIILVEWVDKALQQSLKKENIKFGFRVYEIWPLNSIAMVTKFGPSEVFTIVEEEDLGNSNHLDTTMQTNNSEDEIKAPT